VNESEKGRARPLMPSERCRRSPAAVRADESGWSLARVHDAIVEVGLPARSTSFDGISPEIRLASEAADADGVRTTESRWQLGRTGSGET
jgi:hypothetical protein